MPWRPAVAQIKNLAERRQRKKLQRKIQLLTKNFPDNAEVITACLSSLVQAGMFEGAYTLALAPARKKQTFYVSSLPTWRLLFLAEALDFLGAPGYALSLLDSMPLGHPGLLVRAAGVYVRSFGAESALRLLSQVDARELSDEVGFHYSVARARALHQVGDPAGALAAAEAGWRFRPDSLRSCWLRHLEASLFASIGESDRAMALLARAEAPMPGAPRVHATVLMYKGVVLRLAGQENESKRAFSECERTLLVDCLNRDPISLVRVVAYKALHGIASEEELRLLRTYPGLPRSYRSTCSGWASTTVGKADSEWVFYADSGEYVRRSERSPQLPIELRLLMLLRMAGPWGIHSSHAKCVLWPDGLTALSHLDGRLSHLVMRLRQKYRIRIRVERRCVYLHPSQYSNISIVCDGDPTPSFLRDRREFSREDLAQYYKFSRTQAFKLLQDWTARFPIDPFKKGRLHRYRVRNT